MMVWMWNDEEKKIKELNDDTFHENNKPYDFMT